jgi:hypothetical protein
LSGWSRVRRPPGSAGAWFPRSPPGRSPESVPARARTGRRDGRWALAGAGRHGADNGPASCGGLPGPATRRAAGDPEPDAIGCAARGSGQTGKPRPGVPAWAAGLRLRGRRRGLVRRMLARGARVSRRRETTGRFQAFDLLLAQATKGRTREDFGPGRAPRRGAGPGARARIAASGARPDHLPPDRTGRRPTQAPPPTQPRNRRQKRTAGEYIPARRTAHREARLSHSPSAHLVGRLTVSPAAGEAGYRCRPDAGPSALRRRRRRPGGQPDAQPSHRRT